MSRRFMRTVSKAVPFKRKPEPLPIELQLGTNALRFMDDGQWRLESGDLDKLEFENEHMREETRQLREEAEALRKSLATLSEEANMVRFQNQLLLEMVAVCRVDEQHFRERIERQALREAELARELERAYSKIIDGGIDAGVSMAA